MGLTIDAYTSGSLTILLNKKSTRHTAAGCRRRGSRAIKDRQREVLGKRDGEAVKLRGFLFSIPFSCRSQLVSWHMTKSRKY